MKYKYITRQIITCFLILYASNSFGQYMNVPNLASCGASSLQFSSQIPSNGTLKALIVFIKFKGDNFNLPPYTDGWPSSLGTFLPAWAYNILSPSVQPGYTNPSLSGYFKSMSLGNFEILGSEYPTNGHVYETVDEQNVYYVNPECGALGTKRLSYAVYEALSDLDPQIDYTQYDNDGPDGVADSGDDDGYVDQIVIWFRFHVSNCTDGSSYSGINTLTGFNSEFIPGVVEISTQDIGHSRQPIKINRGSGVIAEGTSDKGINIFAHELGHNMGFDHDPWQGYYSLMTWEGMGLMNSWERKEKGWIDDYMYVSSTVLNYPLKDYETYGDAIKIALPNNEYYLLENRQPIEYYSTNWLVPDNGLIISKFQNSVPNMGYFRIQCADHRWNWESNSGIYSYPYIKHSPNNSGLFEMDFFGGYNEYTSICVNLPGQYCGNLYAKKYHPDAHGDSKDLWDIGYNQVFSPWSNPQSSMSNLGIEIKSKDANGTMYLDIVFENPELLSPSKPLWLRTSMFNFEPGNAKVFHPQLDWLANTEPDVSGYEIYKGWVTNPNVDPQYVLVATINNGSTTSWIDESATLYEEGGGSGGCIYQPITLAYRIVAFDSQRPRKVSVRSDSALISGYADPCAPLPRPGNENTGVVPGKFGISNYPNPFNPSTQIKYDLPKSSFVTIEIYNSLGEEVSKIVSEFREAGSYSVTFDGSNFSSGIYFYSIEAGQYKETKKMVLIK